jgi:hypothetical protein
MGGRPAQRVWETDRHPGNEEEPAMAKRSDTDVVFKSKARIVPADAMPLTEFCFDRAGAASPFGDDLALPLAISELTYVHPSPDAFPQHL